MPKKRSPFHQPLPKRGNVVAVQLENGLWCYVREYVLCYGFLPFLSKSPLTADQLPTLQAPLYFDLWCYDTDKTPMMFIGKFPFTDEAESIGEPCYTAPDIIDNCYTIHEVSEGIARLRKTKDATAVSGMRLQRRYKPPEFGEFLQGKTSAWPIL